MKTKERPLLYSQEAMNLNGHNYRLEFYESRKGSKRLHWVVFRDGAPIKQSTQPSELITATMQARNAVQRDQP
jgi:hypothetical protein